MTIRSPANAGVQQEPHGWTPAYTGKRQVIGRRAMLIGLCCLSEAAIGKATFPPPPKVGAVRWPGAGHDIHGYMAVPGNVQGRQPAVLVVPDRTGADQFALGLVDALATAGFVACIPKGFASTDEVVATVRWLAGNRYATGKVAAVGLGWGCELVVRVRAASPVKLAGAVLFGGHPPDVGEGPIIALDSVEALGAAGGSAYRDAWQHMIGFLQETLK